MDDYILEEQIGFLLRQVNQRHTVIFSEQISSALTPTQFAVLVKLRDLKQCSQNELGRHTAMDAATVKGVVERLKVRGFVKTLKNPTDKRRLDVELTKKGAAATEKAVVCGSDITEKTLSPLSQSERRNLLRILKKLRD